MNEIKTKTKNFNKYHFIVNLFILFAVIGSGVYYILSVNDLAIKGFIMADLKKSLDTENKISAEMEMEIMKLKSLENISQRAQRFQLVKVDKVDYVKIAPSVVAKR